MRPGGAGSWGCSAARKMGASRWSSKGRRCAWSSTMSSGRGWCRNCEGFKVAASNPVVAGNRELVMLVDVLAREKNVPRDIVFGALEMALASATKKKYTEDIDVRVQIDKNTGNYETFRRWRVLPDVVPEWDTAHVLSVAEDQDSGTDDAEGEDVIDQPIPNGEFGRIGAELAKPAVLMRIRA